MKVKITPHFVTFVIVFMILSGAFIAVDSIAVTEYHKFVKDSTNDILVDIGYNPEKYEPGDFEIDSKALNYFRGLTTDFPYVKRVAIIHHFRSFYPVGNTSLDFIRRIYSTNSSEFDFLNITITRGTFTDGGLSIREDIFSALHLKIGDLINFTYSVKVEENYTRKTTFLPVTSTFRVNNSLISGHVNSSRDYYSLDIYVLVPEDTFFFLLNNLTISETRSFIIGDIDSSFIDRVTPERSLDYMNNWIRKFESHYELLSVLEIYFPIFNELRAYVNWKSTLKANLLYSILPAIIVMWIVIHYLNEMYLDVHQREILILVTRGYPKEKGFTMLAKELGISFGKGLLTGLVFGVLVSRFFMIPLYQLIIPAHSNASILSAFLTAPLAISYLSIIDSVMYCAFAFIGLLLLITASKLYNAVTRNLLKKTKHGLKRLLLVVGVTYSDVILILFSLLVFFLVANTVHYFREIQRALQYSLLLQITLIMTPFTFIVGTTKLVFRGLKRTANFSANAFKKKSYFWPVFLGLKNISRKSGKHHIVAITFALIIAFSQASIVTSTAYKPSIYANYRWKYGSDVNIQFFMDHPNVSLVTEMAKDLCSNVSRIESYTIIFETSVRLPVTDDFAHLIGIDPDTFLNTVYTDKNILFKESQYAEVINDLKNSTNGGVISEALNISYHFYEGDTLQGTYYNQMFYIRVIDEIDYAFYYYTFSWTYSGEIRKYILTTLNVIEALKGYTYVSILIKITDGENTQHKVLEAIDTRLNELKYKYIELKDAKLFMVQKFVEREMHDIDLVLRYNADAISIAISLILFLIVIWANTQVIKARRSRYIAVLLALGVSVNGVALSILFELLFVLSYAILIGTLASVPFSLILGLFVGVNGEFIVFFAGTTDYSNIVLFTILFSLSVTIAGGILVIKSILQKEKTQLLKLEWTPEKYLENLGVIWS